MATGKIKQTKVLTAIVGSYPKPKYISKKTGREFLNDLGISFKASKGSMDKAALLAINDQNDVAMDFITDGEERRSHYVLHILKGLKGIDFTELRRIKYRGGALERDVPVVKGKIRFGKPILKSEFMFTKKFATGTAKIGLPGPLSAVGAVADDYYGGDLKKMAFDYAAAIHKEVASLIKAGCRVIQFDDPVLLRDPKVAKAWGLEALERCFEGLEDKATFIVHICRGYPNKSLDRKGIEHKSNQKYYKDVLSWLSKSKLDVVSIEGQEGNLDLSVLPAIGKKTVMLGVLDIGVNQVETVKSLVARAKEALRYIPKNQLILAPDCGMLELSRVAAKRKLANMVKAAQIINNS